MAPNACVSRGFRLARNTRIWVDFGRHDSGVRRHQGKTLDDSHDQRPDGPPAHRRRGCPLAGHVAAEPDPVTPIGVRLASTKQCGKQPSDTGVMPQKILLYRFPAETTALSYPHAWEKSRYLLSTVPSLPTLASQSGHRQHPSDATCCKARSISRSVTSLVNSPFE